MSSGGAMTFGGPTVMVARALGPAGRECTTTVTIALRKNAGAIGRVAAKRPCASVGTARRLKRTVGRFCEKVP